MIPRDWPMYPTDGDLVPGVWDHRRSERTGEMFARPVGVLGMFESVFNLRCRTHTLCAETVATDCSTARTSDPVTRTNPKDAAAFDRAPLHLLPIVAQIEWCLAHMEGGSKYGFWNFEIVGVRASVYIAAAFRHLGKWAAGEEYETWTDPADGTVHKLAHHLGYVMACCAILIDSQSRSVLTDDRGPRHPALPAAFARAGQVLRSIQLAFGDKKPKHFTIEDSAPPR